MASVESEIAVLGIREAAAYVGSSVMTLRRRVTDGTLHPRKVGNAWAFSRSELDAFVAARKQDVTTHTD